MKLSKRIKLLIALAILGFPGLASSQVRSAVGNLTTSASECSPTTTTSMVVLNTSGMGTIGVELTGTWTGTVTFKISNNGTSWDTARVHASNDSTLLSSVTANGHWTGNIAAFNFFCAVFLSSPTGTATVNLNAIPVGGSSDTSSSDVSTSTDTIATNTGNAATFLQQIAGNPGVDAVGGQNTPTQGPAPFLAYSSSNPTAAATGKSIAARGSQYGETNAVICDAAGNNRCVNVDSSNRLTTVTRQTDGTNFKVLDPCESNTKLFAVINISSATTTQLIAASSSNSDYICSIHFNVSAADNIAFVEDDTAACASPTAGLAGGTTAATGWNLIANEGMTFGNGGSSVFKTAATNRYACLITSSSAQVSGNISYVQAP